MLRVEGVFAGYYEDIHILQGVSLEAKQGCLTSIIGTNGVGKSTLLKTIYGFLHPSRGSIFYQDEDITGLDPFRAPLMGLTYIAQRRNVFPEMTVEENLMMGAWTFKGERQRLRRKVEEAYQRFPILRERRNQKARTLSGGQQRMVELGRGMMIDPQLMLVDEPTAGLAPMFAREIYDKLVELKDAGMTILLVDQNIRQAIEVSDYVYVLGLGKNMTEGPREEFANLQERIRDWF